MWGQHHCAAVAIDHSVSASISMPACALADSSELSQNHSSHIIHALPSVLSISMCWHTGVMAPTARRLSPGSNTVGKSKLPCSALSAPQAGSVHECGGCFDTKTPCACPSERLGHRIHMVWGGLRAPSKNCPATHASRSTTRLSLRSVWCLQLPLRGGMHAAKTSVSLLLT